MVYSNKFVAVIKVGGQILREMTVMDSHKVLLPFGSEYSIYLKNLESKRALVKVSIDGKNISESGDLIISPNSEYDLKGFIGPNGFVRNKFKFIQKTEKVVKHRGDKIDDGLIRIEYAYEKHIPLPVYQPIIHEHHYHYQPWYWTYTLDQCNTRTIGNSTFNITSSLNSPDVNYCNHVKVDEGITVKGSEMCESIGSGSIGELEPSSVIVIELRGVFANVQISKPLTTKAKITCESCGTKLKSSSKYCTECGTHVTLS